jgi:hypothetical protein
MARDQLHTQLAGDAPVAGVLACPCNFSVCRALRLFKALIGCACRGDRGTRGGIPNPTTPASPAKQRPLRRSRHLPRPAARAGVFRVRGVLRVRHPPNREGPRIEAAAVAPAPSGDAPGGEVLACPCNFSVCGALRLFKALIGCECRGDPGTRGGIPNPTTPASPAKQRPRCHSRSHASTRCASRGLSLLVRLRTRYTLCLAQ